MIRESKLLNGDYYLPDNNGHFVSEKQRRIAEILHDYNPELELQWIPPGERSNTDVAFRVVHRPPGRPPYVALTASELDERLLARVIHADRQRAPQALGGARNHLDWIDSYNTALELTRAKKDEDERMEAHEMAYAAYRSPKYHYKMRVNGELLDMGKPYGGRYE